MNCMNCGEPIIWVPERGGRWTHYRADKTCGKPAPEGRLYDHDLQEARIHQVLSPDELEG